MPENLLTQIGSNRFYFNPSNLILIYRASGWVGFSPKEVDKLRELSPLRGFQLVTDFQSLTDFLYFLWRFSFGFPFGSILTTNEISGINNSFFVLFLDPEK